MNKLEVENRLIGVANYTGQRDFVQLVTASMPAKKDIGLEANWMIARACMTPAEYINFGYDGKPWNFMKGKPDIAQRCIDATRAVVSERCERLGFQCDWSRI